MENLKFCVVATTIGKGDFLDGYCKQAELEGVKENLEIIVIPDKKHPLSCI